MNNAWIKSYIKLFLQELGFTNINTLLLEEEQKCAFGFNGKSLILANALLKNLNLQGAIYQKDEHFILTVSYYELENLAKTLFQKVFKGYSHHYDGYYKNGDFYLHRYDFLRPELANKGISQESIVKTYYYTAPSFSMHHAFYVYSENNNLYELRSYDKIFHFLTVTDITTFFNVTGKDLACTIFNKEREKVFLAAMKTGRGRHPLFEVKLVNNIFSFAEEKTIPKDATKLSIVPTHQKDWITHYIALLNTEVKHSFFSWNDELKKRKIQFFELVKNFQGINPSLSIKTCIEVAKKENPYLYSQAIKGSYSTRAKNLITKILSERDMEIKSLTLSKSS